ncbi:hypothetical protein GTO27_08755 [Candidatus Bathyarchaeota archaeon]|nr:hypothetical protein [Candidatus Bathyarchaeota archaeon]
MRISGTSGEVLQEGAERLARGTWIVVLGMELGKMKRGTVRVREKERGTR